MMQASASARRRRAPLGAAFRLSMPDFGAPPMPATLKRALAALIFCGGLARLRTRQAYEAIFRQYRLRKWAGAPN